MKTLLAIAILLTMPATLIDPHFTRTPKGWVPSCPSGTKLVRHVPGPDCLLSNQPMDQKPTFGEMECVSQAKVKKLKACTQ